MSSEMTDSPSATCRESACLIDARGMSDQRALAAVLLSRSPWVCVCLVLGLRGHRLYLALGRLVCRISIYGVSHRYPKGKRQKAKGGTAGLTSQSK
ncbi:hypothetical protein MGYG_04379 [Nannizzia gypsea CBS 118893]|uniref:Uncharacterized protein n=1 Tax=Arthroderma gypseum (strain ATCC MYA-4604 / CBS 118893) TaxID=535722 RepID=E4USM1_ARTGP|nr:hypothetical protein MGYG_04379 [Nannizzia gypsea CBS 118893]EFR01372.1 hypothetical protein MGYG_04379 [Nannizzia gypsea CBS 118893]